MKAFYQNLLWEKGTHELVQGCKNRFVPKNAIYGGNGSFIVENPATLLLTVVTEDERIITRNIISLVKEVNGWQRLSEKRFCLVRDQLERIKEFSIDNNDYISNLNIHVSVD